MEGRIIAGYATVHRDDFIPLWAKLGEAVHSFDCKFIMQLSHSGRQMDLPGVHNQARRAAELDQPPGIAARLPVPGDEQGRDRPHDRGLRARRVAGARGRARRRRAARGERLPVHPVPVARASTTATDEYGGSLENRARFLLDVIEAIRGAVGRDFHLQVKLSAVDHNNVIPWEKPGNTLADTVRSPNGRRPPAPTRSMSRTGSLFPAPAQSAGRPVARDADHDLRRDDLVGRARHAQLPSVPLSAAAGPIFHWVWFRMKKGKPVEGVNLDEARVIKKAVNIPVICTGGFQTASFIREAIKSGGVRRRLDRALAGRQQRSRQAMGRPAPTVPRSRAPTATAAWSARRRIRWAATSVSRYREPRGDGRRGDVDLPRARRTGDPDRRGDVAMNGINTPFTAVQITLASADVARSTSPGSWPSC